MPNFLQQAELFPLFQAVLHHLTQLEICIVAVTCDGTSDNQRMFCLHNLKDKMIYKTKHVLLHTHSLPLWKHFLIVLMRCGGLHGTWFKCVFVSVQQELY